MADVKVSRTPSERFLLARAAAVRTFPYLETVIVSMGYAVDEGIVTPGGMPTMAVTERAQMLVHPQFLLEIIECGGVKALAFVIAHEAFHILMNHAKRKRKVLLREPDADLQLLGIALDLSINPSLKAAAEKVRAGSMGITPPTGKLTGVFPSDFGLEDGLTFEAYYGLLKQKKKAGKLPKLGDGQGTGQPGQGCAPQEGDELSESAQAVADKTGGWTEARTERIVKSAMEKAQRHEEQNRGSVPAGLLLEIEDGLKPPRVHWTDALRSMVCTDIEHRSGAEDAIWTTPSRRQAGIGHGIGKAMLPGLVEFVPRVGVIQDTSGSMGGTLGMCVSEIMGLIAHLNADVEVAFCDTQVTDGGRVGTVQQITSQMTGGGGTDMNAALDLLQKKNIDVGVCLTDGWIGSPGEYRGYPVIWVITPNGSENDVARSVEQGWGRILRMVDDDLPPSP